MVLGFDSDPVARWCWPEPDSYLANMPKFINAYGGRAFKSESAWTDDSYHGGALWLPPNIDPDEESLGELMVSTMPEEKQGYLFASLEEIETYHPKEPHWTLPLIAVNPMAQNKGVGSALLKAALIECDKSGVPSFLESSNPRNVGLYERFGFKVISRVQHGICPPFTAMLREPQI